MSGHNISLAGQLQAMSEDVWPTSAHPHWFQGKHTGLSWQLNRARPLTQRADIDYERKTVREGDEMKGQKQERRRKQRVSERVAPPSFAPQNIISMMYSESLPLLLRSTMRQVTCGGNLKFCFGHWMRNIAHHDLITSAIFLSVKLT